MSRLADFENKDRPGTYDGVTVISVLTGLSRDEIAWMSRRVPELLRSGHSRAEAKAIVLRESEEIRQSGGRFP